MPPVLGDTRCGAWRRLYPDVDEEWTRTKSYEIEIIVSATRVGRGWQLQVKWKGYPTATPEPLYRILADTNHPDILPRQPPDEFPCCHPGGMALCPLTLRRSMETPRTHDGRQVRARARQSSALCDRVDPRLSFVAARCKSFLW